MNAYGFPRVVKREDIDRHEGEIVWVEGIYRLIDVRIMRKAPDLLLLGHVGIVLNDKTCVYLLNPDTKEAIRDKEEVKNFKNRRVRIEGKVLPFIKQKGDIPGHPCITELFSIDKLG